MAFALVLMIAAASPAGWTFCVAESGRDIWITDVFAASRGREKLEADFAAQLRARGVDSPDAQCPAPRDDKTEAVNAQSTAIAFHRKLGDKLHSAALPAAER